MTLREFWMSDWAEPMIKPCSLLVYKNDGCLSHSILTSWTREIELKLENLARQSHKSKTELIRTALERFFSQEESEKDSYELGEAYFGQYGSGDGTLSTTYKVKLKEKINAKLHPH